MESSTKLPLSATAQWPSFPSLIDRYYTRFYGEKDVYMQQHANGIFALGIACGHPIRSDRLEVEQVQFDQSVFGMSISGKRKRGGKKMKKPGSSLLHIRCTNGESFQFSSPIFGKVIEVNSALLSNPALLHDSPDTNGWLALIMVDKHLLPKVCDMLLTEEAYAQIKQMKLAYVQTQIK